MRLLTPRRRRGVERIDDPRIDPELLKRSMRDVARANLLFGGALAVTAGLRGLLRAHRGGTLVLLDVGTGLGDLPHRARRMARRYDVHLVTLGLDRSFALTGAAHSAHLPTVQADALALPFGDRSVDVVLCSQLLHHFHGPELFSLLRELDRVTRRLVLVAELRRSWLAAALFWLVSWPLRFESVTRHDGTLSVLRGFTRRELFGLVHAAVGHSPEIRRHPGFRLTAIWSPGAAP
jgi:2-polyprenyl-3-methyl-5-hydroxy-6-metoxy-1,4-benzoquinol methylase